MQQPPGGKAYRQRRSIACGDRSKTGENPTDVPRGKSERSNRHLSLSKKAENVGEENLLQVVFFGASPAALLVTSVDTGRAERVIYTMVVFAMMDATRGRRNCLFP